MEEEEEEEEKEEEMEEKEGCLCLPTTIQLTKVATFVTTRNVSVWRAKFGHTLLLWSSRYVL